MFDKIFTTILTTLVMIGFMWLVLTSDSEGAAMKKCQETQSVETCMHTLMR